MLARDTKAHVFVAVLHHGQFYTYASHESNSWPPTAEQIVSTTKGAFLPKKY